MIKFLFLRKYIKFIRIEKNINFKIIIEYLKKLLNE